LENTYTIRITGLVQGVGFRPYIYRLAQRFGLKGWVENRTDGVIIKINTDTNTLGLFQQAIFDEKPPASSISSLETECQDQAEFFENFTIVKSTSSGTEITQVSPDIAVCEDCMKDLKSQPHRIDYPFINCTNCGPRFTIIKDLPYDRQMTTMQPFEMCSQCKKEYTDILDRRFHAQPVACQHCGPQYELHINGVPIKDFNQILEKTTKLLKEGQIIAIKGMGGYFLACDAQNEKTVSRLRKAKNRDGKPFAVMFRDLQTLKKFQEISLEEESILSSWRSPILLAKNKNILAPSVSVGFPTTGVLLPYMPIHYLLFERLTLPAIVLTSGNISDEPIIIEDKLAFEKLQGFTDAILSYNREIYMRTDDSVTTFVNGKERLIRRSRGYVPTPIETQHNVEGILACGAELVNCFALGRNQQAILSQHIGDLKNLETLEFFTESIERFERLFQFKAQLIAHDMHPGYLSTKWAKEQNVELIEIQHHHAHIVSCLAENKINEKVIGVAMDGIGYGDDGKIWGGEIMLCTLDDYQRELHFEYIPMPGGDAATKHPWRMLLSYLFQYFGDEIPFEKIPAFQNIDPKEIALIVSALKAKINCPLTSSAGRLFDAVSALLGLCSDASFHAEAPMRLESVIAENIHDGYSFSIGKTIGFKETFMEMIEDLNAKVSIAEISAKFHNTLINVIFAAVLQTSQQNGIKKVALSGGSFQNRYLLSGLENKLTENGFEVYSQQQIPANDGGLALGQLIIASEKRRLKCV
jgi:hydrogenase maturation protein HypF